MSLLIFFRPKAWMWTGGILSSVAAAFAICIWMAGGDGAPESETPSGESRSDEVTFANRRSRLTGFPSRFCEHQVASARGTAPYAVVLADGASKAESIQAVRACGARVIGPLPPNALLVETSVFALGKLSQDRHFSAATEWLPEDKVDARLKPLVESGAAMLNVTLVALAPSDVEGLVRLVAGKGGERLKGCLNGRSSVTLSLPRALVLELAKRGDVRWLEPFARPKLLNDLAVEPAQMNVRTVWDAHELTGEGQFVTTSDSGIDTGNLATMHADLRNRLAGFRVVDGCDSSDRNGHGTHTAGSIVGDGTLSDGRIRGVACGAKLWAWFCGGPGSAIYLPDSCDELFRPDGATEACVHSGSWGDDTAGAYDSMCRLVDEYVWDHPDFLPVIANGNAGSAVQTVGSPATAKNVLAVGATENARSDGASGWGNGDPTKIASYSSRGPCVDGRIKPDLASPGSGVLSTRAYACSYGYGIHSNTNYAYDSGTSMATPLTAGAAALVRQWLVERRGFTNGVPTAALVKAVLTGGAKGASVPDNSFGWGRTDVGESLYPSNRAVRLVDRIPFAHGSERIYPVTLTNDAPLDVQLVWIDYPATAGASVTLVNDLDLVVSNRTTGSVWYGNGTTGGDHANTVESVRLAAATPGDYDVIVRGRDVPYASASGGAAALYLRGAFDSETNLVDETTVPVTARTVSVDARTGDDSTATGETNAPYATISAALAHAAEGDVLRVGPGSYAGELAVPSVSVRIESTDGPASTILDGGGTNRCYDGSANAATVLSGFTLTNGWIDASRGMGYGAGAYGGGVFMGTLSNCVIRNCRAAWGGGGAYEATLYGCAIVGCEAGLQGGGAYASKLVNCTVRGCRARTLRSTPSKFAGGGIDCQCVCTNTIVWGNLGPSGGTDNWEVYGIGEYRHGRWHSYGTYVPYLYWCCTTPSCSVSENCIADDPLFVSTNDIADVRLYDSSPCLGAGRDGANIGAYSGTGIMKVLPTIDLKTATGEEVSNAVASVGYVDKSVETGIGTNARTYAAFSVWSTNGLKSTAVVFSTRAYDSFLVREIVAEPTLLGEGLETSVELTALEPASDGTCSTVLRLVDGTEPVPLCSAKAAFAKHTLVGDGIGALAPADASAVGATAVEDGLAVKLTITPPPETTRYFMRFSIGK